MTASLEHTQQQHSHAIPQHSRRKANKLTAMPFFNAGCSRDLRITGVSKSDNVWMYHVEVLDIRTGLLQQEEKELVPGSPCDDQPSMLPPVVRYSVMRRYNDFRRLYLSLLDSHGDDMVRKLPAFPDGGFLSYVRADNHKLLRYRKEQLQLFLRAMDEHAETKWCRALMEFLRPTTPDHKQSLRSASVLTSSMSSHSKLLSSTTNSGYVSLSFVQSPQIRFRKQDESRGCLTRRRAGAATVKVHQRRGPCTELQKLLSLESPL
ncbi:TPA: hypothetical protein N0F65_002970 [Lagenidium giganteum]|uniref:PX domain-containing protein n=1 Tax=Lagenidium giganteum TaxID=4803 RepID=A0AAV2YNM6_9STRA|nr:TPA: hypothetical protein N0F65_002970 [Lagenidium giganteum]